MQKFYIGLGNTFHDAAMAVVSSEGQVLFAEGSERNLQSKRAYGMTADVRETVRQVIKDYCHPQATFVVAKPWSQKMNRFMHLMHLTGATNHELISTRPRRMTRFLVGKHILFTDLWLQYAGFMLSGGNIADILVSDFGNNRISFVRFDHHLAHAANACFTSPFDEAACMIVDGQGEWGSISYFAYQGGRLKELHRVKGEESLGMCSSVCTGFCGFNVEKGEEWKLMGLAPYGNLDQEILADFRSLVKVDGLWIKSSPLPKSRLGSTG